VEPLAVVKDFDPFKDGRPGFVPRGEQAAMQKLIVLMHHLLKNPSFALQKQMPSLPVRGGNGKAQPERSIAPAVLSLIALHGRPHAHRHFCMKWRVNPRSGYTPWQTSIPAGNLIGV
jgi:hypothetical protein